MQTCDVEIIQSEVDVSQQAVVLIDNTIDASIETISPIVQVNAEEYVLSSGGMYGGSAMVGAVPKWILDAVQQQLTTGDGNLATVVSDIQALLGTLQTGVSQVVQSLNTLSSSTSSITTALQSEVNQNHSEVMNIVATKVDATQAQSVALNAINSTFGSDVNAYIGNIASTYVDENSAIGQEVNMLTATIGDVSASISDISSVTVEEVLNPLWVDDGIQTDPDINGEPRYILQAKAKKQLSVDANGVVTGLILESGATSSMTLQADQFKLVASGQSVASRNPFTVDATTGEITLNGKVSFNSVTDAPPMVAENTNINVTTNLVPNDGWYASGHADYLFVGTPTYYKMIGANTFQEDTLLLNAGDEVYTPYISDFTKSYKISYAFKGALIGALFQIDGATASNANVVLSGTYDPAKWYIVQALVLPNGSTAGTLFGKVQDAATLNTVVTITDKVLAAATDWFCLGFIATADTYISRVAIEVVNTDTVNAIPVTSSNLTTALAATSTVIDGGRITTGTITANQIAANAISGKIITGGEINGTVINGSYINGTVIKSSWIDLTSTFTLTNWQMYTPATIPSAYLANFAHNNDGTLVVDNLGYVRLQGLPNILTGIVSLSYTNASISNIICPIYSKASYQVNSINRAIASPFSILLESSYSDPVIYVAQSYYFNYTGSMSGSFSIFDDLYEFSGTASMGSSTSSTSGFLWLKKNGTYIYNQSIGSYGNIPTYSVIHTTSGISYKVECNHKYYGGQYAISVSISMINQANICTNETSSPFIKINNLQNTYHNYGTDYNYTFLKVNIPICRVVS